MLTLLRFLEDARFPSPPVSALDPASATDLSDVDIGLVDDSWKARRAVKDIVLADHLCDALAGILGDTPLVAGTLDTHFSPHLDNDTPFRIINDSDHQSLLLLTLGVNRALDRCVQAYNPQLGTIPKPTKCDDSRRSRLDMAIVVGNTPRILLAVRSPTVMTAIGDTFPDFGFELKWVSGQTKLISKVFLNVAAYLGLRKLEWLFLTCHNSWVIFRLTTVGGERVLAFSPLIEISDSSIPFRAYLGALLSTVEGFPVNPTIIPVNAVLDTLPEEDAHREVGGEDGGDGAPGSGDHDTPSENGGSLSDPPVDSGNSLMFTSSPADSPNPHWVQLHKIMSGPSAPSFPLNWGESRTLRIAKFLGEGSTGSVYESFMGTRVLATKVVDLARYDGDKRRRLRSEADIYSCLERAYVSGKLAQRIAPQFYGIFESKSLDVLVMELQGGRLSHWNDLGHLECEQVFSLVKQLHSVGMMHGDIEPQNIVRSAGGGGGLLLVDFSESQRHSCRDRGHFDALVLGGPPKGRKPKCLEILYMWELLDRRCQNP